jgi:hypothetical protein
MRKEIRYLRALLSLSLSLPLSSFPTTRVGVGAEVHTQDIRIVPHVRRTPTASGHGKGPDDKVDADGDELAVLVRAPVEEHAGLARRGHVFRRPSTLVLVLTSGLRRLLVISR